MDLVVKAFLSKAKGVTEVRRFPFPLSSTKDLEGKFDLLQAQLASSFPDLKDKQFIVSWKDADGDYVLLSSDEELLEALSEMNTKQLRLYLTECPAEIGSDAAATLFPVQSSKRRARGPWMRVSEEEAGERSVKDDKGWKTALRDLVPTMHRRWAKGHIRQWRQKHLANGTTTGSSDGEKVQKVTAEEAEVPPAYVKYLDTQVYRLHKVWAQEKPGKVDKDFEEAKAAVPEAFQNWCRWYLKKTFGPNRTPRFRPDKTKPAASTEQKTEGGQDVPAAETKDQQQKGEETSAAEEPKGAKQANAWRKEWRTMRKQIRDAVPLEHRVWTKSFIPQWRRDNLPEVEQSRYVTDSAPCSSDSADESKEDKAGAKDVPENYSSWLSLYLTQWHANQGDSLAQKQVKQAAKEIRNITDSEVPPSYRKWVKFYMSRTLSKAKKDKQKEAEVLARRQYNRWMIAFQRKWSAQQDGASGASSADESETTQQKRKAKPEEATGPRVIIERLQGIIDSDGEFENELPVPPLRKPHSEFRHWALEILGSWDGATVGQGLPAKVLAASSTAEDEDEQEMPPGVLNWMRKAMARILIKRLRAELREARRAAEGQKGTEKGEEGTQQEVKGDKAKKHPHQE